VDNTRMLEKAVITTGELASTALLSPTQAKKFIQQVFDATPTLTIARRITMPATKYNIDKIGIGRRIARKATQNTAPGFTVPVVTTGAQVQVQLDAQEIILPWEVSLQSLEDTLEGANFEDTLMNMMTSQLGVDLEDLYWNGDTTNYAAVTLDLVGNIDAVVTSISFDGLSVASGLPSASLGYGYIVIGTERIAYTGITWATTTSGTFTGCTRGADDTTAALHNDPSAITFVGDALLPTLNGWIVQLATGSNLVDGSLINDGNISKEHFSAIIRAMEPKYLSGAAAAKFRFIMHPITKVKYLDYLAARMTGVGDAVLTGLSDVKPYGWPIVETTAMPQSTIVFTDPNNLIIGIHRDIRISKTSEGKDLVSRRARYYQIDARIDCKIEEKLAAVKCTGLV